MACHEKWLEGLLLVCCRAGSSAGDIALMAEISVLCLGGPHCLRVTRVLGLIFLLIVSSVRRLLFYIYSLSNHLYNVHQPLLPLRLRFT